MHLAEMGIDPDTRIHRKNPLTREENAFLGILWVDHVGEENKISAQYLARAYARQTVNAYADARLSAWMRDVRKMHNHLLFDHNIPVLSKAGNDGGYWVAANEKEAIEFYKTFRKRGLTGLVKASRGKQSAMVDMVAQLSFEFDEMIDMTDQASEKPATRQATPIEVVDAFLKRMTENPEQYADGLRRIGEKYGNVLLPRHRFEQMVIAVETQATALHRLAKELRG